jgi:hypothetical protein
MKSQTFNGRKYWVEVNPPKRIDGSCSTYKPDRELVIYADMKTRNGLVTAIHEALHACRWPASEEAVDKTSYDIGRFLWGLGYRRVERKK